MARFIFQLEGVLRHRKNVEHQRQRDVAEIQAQMTKLQTELLAMDAEVQAVNKDVLQHHMSGKIDASCLIAHRRFMAGAQKRAVDLAQRMGAVQVKLDVARRALTEAAKERKVMEKLKEKQQESWQLAVSRKEAAAMDEVAMQISVRKMLAEAAEGA
jgi:flagellar FliJ protein